MNDDDRIRLRKRVEMKWLQTYRGDPTTREAIRDLWRKYLKHAVVDLPEYQRFTRSYRGLR
jgi:hypothetical protein